VFLDFLAAYFHGTNAALFFGTRVIVEVELAAAKEQPTVGVCVT